MVLITTINVRTEFSFNGVKREYVLIVICVVGAQIINIKL